MKRQSGRAERRECARSLGSFPSLGVTLPIGITPGRPSNQPWLDWLLAAHGPQAGVLAGHSGTPCWS